jgi:hypothetical protein
MGIASNIDVKELSNINERKSFYVTVPKYKETRILDENNWTSNLIVRPFRDPKLKTKRIKSAQKTEDPKSSINRKSTYRPGYNQQGYRRHNYPRATAAEYRNDEQSTWMDEEYLRDGYYDDYYSRQQQWQEYNRDYSTSYARPYWREW